MTLRSILVLKSTCSDDSSDSDTTVTGRREEQHSSGVIGLWQGFQNSAPIVCDLVLLPELPSSTPESNNSNNKKRTSFRERRQTATPTQETVTQVHQVTFQPCGLENVLLFEDLPNESENFLLSLTSCHLPNLVESSNNSQQQQDALLLPIEAAPSTFSFSFAPPGDNEHYVFVPPAKDDDGKTSHASPEEEDASTATAELAVHFDVSEARRLFEEQHNHPQDVTNNNNEQSLVWPWDQGTASPVIDYPHQGMTCAHEIGNHWQEEDLMQNSSSVAGHTNGNDTSMSHPFPTRKLYLKQQHNGTASVQATPDADNGQENTHIPTSTDERHWTGDDETQQFMPPSVPQAEQHSFPTSVPTGIYGASSDHHSARYHHDLMLLQELRSRGQREERLLNAVLYGILSVGLVLIVAFVWLFRRVWKKVHANDYDVLDLQQRSPQLRSELLQCDDETHAAKLRALASLSPIVRDLDKSYQQQVSDPRSSDRRMMAPGQTSTAAARVVKKSPSATRSRTTAWVKSPRESPRASSLRGSNAAIHAALRTGSNNNAQAMRTTAHHQGRAVEASFEDGPTGIQSSTGRSSVTLLPGTQETSTPSKAAHSSSPKDTKVANSHVTEVNLWTVCDVGLTPIDHKEPKATAAKPTEVQPNLTHAVNAHGVPSLASLAAAGGSTVGRASPQPQTTWSTNLDNKEAKSDVSMSPPKVGPSSPSWVSSPLSSSPKTEALSPTSRYAKQWEAAKSLRRKKKKGSTLHRLDPAVSALVVPMADGGDSSVQHHDEVSVAVAPLEDVSKVIQPVKETATVESVSMMPSAETAKPKPEIAEKKKKKKSSQLFISPFISPIDSSTDSAEDSNGNSPGSSEESLLQSYW
ncbi:expressed unknown protein [Seminavis robusta]|uniref:Uncharacterized protein n=1 Tax=Seminavis robusta TaxID=568900 RepID=A0A9N8HE82_9STRA|nr:expressed unknown protein [Seminavis robusta]|eukprot:Sro502_g155550.1 n/a (865) ;mRNA; r:24262-26856